MRQIVLTGCRVLQKIGHYFLVKPPNDGTKDEADAECAFDVVVERHGNDHDSRHRDHDLRSQLTHVQHRVLAANHQTDLSAAGESSDESDAHRRRGLNAIGNKLKPNQVVNP